MELKILSIFLSRSFSLIARCVHLNIIFINWWSSLCGELNSCDRNINNNEHWKINSLQNSVCSFIWSGYCCYTWLAQPFSMYIGQKWASFLSALRFSLVSVLGCLSLYLSLCLLSTLCIIATRLSFHLATFSYGSTCFYFVGLETIWNFTVFNLCNEKEKGNCKSRVAIVLLSCMSEDRESFSCHIYYFVIINCIIFLLVDFFCSLDFTKKKDQQPSKLFHFECVFFSFHRLLQYGLSQERRTIIPHNAQFTISVVRHWYGLNSNRFVLIRLSWAGHWAWFRLQ